MCDGELGTAEKCVDGIRESLAENAVFAEFGFERTDGATAAAEAFFVV